MLKLKDKQTYVGGIVYVNPMYGNKIIEDVLAYAVNSEYPATMIGCENGKANMNGCYGKYTNRNPIK